MDAELPLERGAGHWTWFGGRIALDFVNTRRERWRRDIETLVVPGDLGGWLAEAGLIPEGRESTDDDLATARRLRDAIDEGVDALLAGRPAAEAAVMEIDRWLGREQPDPWLVLRAGQAELEPGEFSVQ